jgi:type I restriction enzyme R subunit
MSNALNEDGYEHQCIKWLKGIDWDWKYGPDIAPEGIAPERSSYKEVILGERLEDAIARINPGLPKDTIRSVHQLLSSPGETDLLRANEIIQGWFVNGIPQRVRGSDGVETSELVRVIDFENIENNDFLAVNQFSVEHNSEAGARRPDIVLFVNGLPLVVIEVKNPLDLDTDIWEAFNQLETYKEHITKLFFYNVALVIADGSDARAGSLTADTERFLKWRSIDGTGLDPHGSFGHTQTLIEGLFNKQNLLDVIQYFMIFVPRKKAIKMFPGYHQFYAVSKAYHRAITASKDGGDGKGGLMWHTQGSGKSYEMACLAGKLIKSSELKNPTIVLVTDRNNLDDQLYDTFVGAKALLRQDPIMADSRDDLRKQIGTRPAGGVVFATIQKFQLDEKETKFPVLTERRNVFVFTDEAHRSQYGFSAKIEKVGFKVGYAQHLRDALPNATFFAFTGTPVAEADRDTRQVFGDEIDIYDMVQANDDGATVPIYYESRLVNLELPEDAKIVLNDLAEQLVEDEEDSVQATLKRRWADLELIVGSEPRIKEIAKDIVSHFTNRCASPELADGKAMVVGMSRNICVDLYKEIIALKPEWHSTDHRTGGIKIVFHSSASDKEKIRPHIYTKQQKRDLENRFKDPADELKIVIVRDMWLTGYDSPPCHTMYVDKPMKGHNLMQAIARVNRVFKNKPGGLVVDYIGIATELKDAIATYTRGKRAAPPIGFLEQALTMFAEKLEIVRDILHGCSIEGFKEKPHEAITKIADFVLNIEDGKKRFADESAALSKAYALVNSHPEAVKHREEVALYQYIRVMLTKPDVTVKKVSSEERDALIRQALSRGIVPEGIVDVFAVAGLDRPNIGLLSEEFLREIRAMKEKNLAVEALSRLLKDQIKSRFRTNIVQNSVYSDELDKVLDRYSKRGIETAQVIEELIALAKKLNMQVAQGNADGLNDYEIAFYDALEANEEAVRNMEHEVLVQLAQELTQKVKKNIKIDWSVREGTRAELRVLVRNLLDKYGYPPDFSKAAIDLVIRQAESLTEEWLQEEFLN